ncbi:acyltransferase family protein [Georgenia sp. Z1491]|uniref:acyltransferase family protein n=1 Tax=Georgenia sp. Z1491 TaxID=3416707 RepID=UPI003CE9D227
MDDRQRPDGSVGALRGPTARTGPPRGGSSARDIVRSGRIPGLDGIRALAVGAVLVFHLFPAFSRGGFIGVDLFFVLSGFLITTLLLREIGRSGRIDLPGFWRRRARRLLPALALVVVVTVPVAALVERDLMVNIGRQVLGALTFSSNWLEIAAGSSYADQTAPQLFVNFWSLAVEEQFYLLWPLLALPLVKLVRAPRALAAVAIVVAVVSGILMAVLVTPGADPTRVYYGTDTHLFGLMLGIALAFVAQDSRGPLTAPAWQRARPVVPFVGLAVLLLLSTFMAFDSVWTFRGGLFAASLAAALLVAALLGPRTWFTAVMELAPLRWLGERSYGIYLWHWPVVIVLDALVPTAEGSAARTVLRLAALVVTLGVSAASYEWLEQPVRRNGIRATLRSWLAAITGFRPAAAAPARMAGALGLLLVAGTGVAVATAPDQTDTAAQIETNEDRLAQQRAEELAAAEEAQGAAGEAPSGGEDAVPGEQPPEAEEGAGEENSGSESPGEEGSGEAAPSDEEPAEETDPIDSDADFSVPTGDELSVFGDSMVVTTLDALEYYYPGVHVSALSNDQWPAGEAVVDAAIEAGTVRRAVVVHYGTNGGVPDPSIPERILDALGPDRPVVLVNLYGASSWIPAANEELERLAEGRDNVAIADWNATATANPGALQADNIHPDIDGAHEYTHTLTAAFEEIAERHGQG